MSLPPPISPLFPYTTLFRSRPALCRARRFHGVPNILAVPLTHLGEPPSVRRHDRAGIGRVGARLRAVDEHLVGAVHRRDGGCEMRDAFLLARGLRLLFRIPHPASRISFPFQVLPHPLPPA